MEEYIRDLYHDELREGFLVTFDRKKVWNVELSLAVLLDGICRAHGLRYFMGGETSWGRCAIGGSFRGRMRWCS